MAYPSMSWGGWEGSMLGQPPAPAYPGVASAPQQFYGGLPGGYSAWAPSPMVTAPYPPPPAPYGAVPYSTAPPSGYPASIQQPTHHGMAQGSFVAPAYGSAAHGSPMQHYQQGGMAHMPARPTLGAAIAAAASVAALHVARPIHGTSMRVHEAGGPTS